MIIHSHCEGTQCPEAIRRRDNRIATPQSAGMLKVPEGTVASRVFRARRQLRRVLEAPARETKSWSR